MILVGQHDSPFVRRVAVALDILRWNYKRRPWSTFVAAGGLTALNPLRRVPVLDGGKILVESEALLDHMDEVAGGARVIPTTGSARRAILQISAFATGLCDKMVVLLCERLLHDDVSEASRARRSTWIEDTLKALDVARAACPTPFWFGVAPGHPDIAVACALRLPAEAHPLLHAPAQRRRLAADAVTCEVVLAFASVVQPFTPPRHPSRGMAVSLATGV